MLYAFLWEAEKQASCLCSVAGYLFLLVHWLVSLLDWRKIKQAESPFVARAFLDAGPKEGSGYSWCPRGSMLVEHLSLCMPHLSILPPPPSVSFGRFLLRAIDGGDRQPFKTRFEGDAVLHTRKRRRGHTEISADSERVD